MKVTVYTSDQGEVSVPSMPDADAAELVESFALEEGPLILTLSDGGVSHVAVRHVVRIDVDPERWPWWRRPIATSSWGGKA